MTTDPWVTDRGTAASVRFVVEFPERGCPVEVQVQPQRSR